MIHVIQYTLFKQCFFFKWFNTYFKMMADYVIMFYKLEKIQK